MRILLLGKDGQLGWELQRSLACLGEVAAFGSPRCSGAGIDLGHAEGLAALVRQQAPDVIVNAAAYTQVDRAESEPALAAAINAEAPAVLASEAARIDAVLVHYSSDYVFDGSGSMPRDENAGTGPLSVYGRTKLDGEEAVRRSRCRHLILRTGWVHSARGRNFAKTIWRLATERDQLTVVDDQIGSPTGANLLADVSAHALRALRDDASLGGVYHCVAAGFTSWHGYAQFVVDWGRTHGPDPKVPLAEIVAVPTSAYPTAARRPLNSRLDTSRLRERFGLHLPPWQQGVERMLGQWLRSPEA
jgi:dTDP-4-dehydrorhamnose reductase